MTTAADGFALAIIWWVCVAVALAPIAGAVVWTVREELIRPYRVPRTEIEKVANELVARHGAQAEEIAFINEDRAWRYCDGFERGKWRRVRRFLTEPG